MVSEYILYCDESTASGEYYSDFYGGALVTDEDFNDVVATLEAAKERYIGAGEIKWTKISHSYCEKYLKMIDVIMDEVEKDRLKIRIMFRDSRIVVRRLTEEQRDRRYFLLYYQFIKHAFGLQYANKHDLPVKVRVNLDELPDKSIRAAEFKEYIEGLSQLSEFKKNNVAFSKTMISEIRSDRHIILQAIDLLLGAMQFRLNRKHLLKPEGQWRRGKRTIAKEAVYKHINARIRKFYPHFNIGVSTGIQGGIEKRWIHPYRHWKFVPKNGELVNDYSEK